MLYATLGTWFMGCKTPQAVTKQPTFQEDLTAYRPVIKPLEALPQEAETPVRRTDLKPTGDNTTEALSYLQELRRLYAAQEEVSGYRVLVYSGLDRTAAEKSLRNAKQILRQHGNYDKVEMEYTQPYFKVFAGFYPTRMDAHSASWPLKENQHKLVETPFVVAGTLPMRRVEQFYTGVLPKQGEETENAESDEN